MRIPDEIFYSFLRQIRRIEDLAIGFKFYTGLALGELSELPKSAGTTSSDLPTAIIQSERDEIKPDFPLTDILSIKENYPFVLKIPQTWKSSFALDFFNSIFNRAGNMDEQEECEYPMEFASYSSNNQYSSYLLTLSPERAIEFLTSLSLVVDNIQDHPDSLGNYLKLRLELRKLDFKEGGSLFETNEDLMLIGNGNNITFTSQVALDPYIVGEGGNIIDNIAAGLPRDVKKILALAGSARKKITQGGMKKEEDGSRFVVPEDPTQMERLIKIVQDTSEKLQEIIKKGKKAL